MKIKDVAKLAGVSTATVSRVINNSSSVKEETRNKVLEIIKKNNYQPNVMAQNLAKQETNIIGIIIPNLDNPFFAKIVNGIYEKAEVEKLGIVLLNSYGKLEKEKECINNLIQQRVKGIIIVPSAQGKIEDLEHFYKLDNAGIPYVFVDRTINGYRFSEVSLENSYGAYLATKKLLEYTSDVAMISGPLGLSTAKKRLNGYKKAIQEIGLKPVVYYGDYKQESGYEIVKKIISKKKLHKALFVANNMMMFGVIKALLENNVDLSKDIKLFSFNKVEAAEVFGVKINYLEFDIKSIGEKAAEILEYKIKGGKSRKIVKIMGKIKSS